MKMSPASLPDNRIADWQDARGVSLNVSSWMIRSVLIIWLTAAGTVFLGSGQAQAIDRVVLQQPAGGGQIAITGTILDYTGESITIRPRQGGTIARHVSSDVIEVTTEYLPEHQLAIDLMSRGDWKAARAQLTATVEKEDRLWVRRIILSQLVRCAAALDEPLAAGRYFAALVQSDPQTIHAHVAPLDWTDQIPDEPLLLQAQQWLKSSHRLTRLLGASHLIRDNSLGPQAVAELQIILRSDEIAARTLAQGQLWKHRLNALELTSTEVARWEETIRSWPDRLQPGAWTVIARGHEHFGQWPQAAAAWIRLPVAFPDVDALAAYAGLRGAIAFQEAGQFAAARTMGEEISQRFASTRHGKDATNWLKTLK